MEDLTFEEQIEEILDELVNKTQKDFLTAIIDEHFDCFDLDTVCFARDMVDSDINAETMYYLWRLTGFYPDGDLFEPMNEEPNMNGLDFALLEEVSNDIEYLKMLDAEEKKVLVTRCYFDDKKFYDAKYVIDFVFLLNRLSELNTKLR